MHSKRNFKLISIAALIFTGSVLGAGAGYFTSEIFKEEYHNNAHYVCAVEPEIQGVYAHKFYNPTDSYYSTQKSYSMNIVGDIQTVWDTYKGAGTKIAIIDDGFDHDHSEYTRSDGSSALLPASRYYYASGSSAYYKSYSSDSTCLDEDWETDTSEWATHGTNTSTTAAAPAGNGGIVGIAPEADILALKIDMSFVAIKAAISYAITQDVDVINMSLGAYAESFTDGFNESQSGSSSIATYLNSVCNNAYNAGIIVVAAAGNEATSKKSYPACNNHVIGVGALAKNKANELAAFTNFNTSTTQADEKNVDILAPGFVYAAGITGKSSSSHSQNWAATQGTSFSSPIVAGAACLWKQKNPEGTPAQFEQQLTESAAGIGTYENATVNPATYYGNNSYQNNLDANLACGRLDIGSLMNYTNEVSGIDISQTEANLYANDINTSTTLSAFVRPTNADNQTIHWTTSNSNVVSISSSTSQSGDDITITAHSAGTATITATSDENSYSATCTVTVTNYIPVQSFALKDSDGNTSGSVTKNRTLQLYPQIEPSTATNKDVLYKSENETIARVNENGLVTGRGVGTTRIYALCGNEQLEAYYNVEVTAAAGTGTFTIKFYDSSTLSETSSTNCWVLSDLNSTTTPRVFIGDESTSSLVTAFSQSKGYKRKGGCALGSSGNTGTITVTVDGDYKIDSIRVVGANYNSSDTGTLSLTTPSKTGTGSLDVAGTTLENCSNAIEFTDLNGITSFTMKGTNRPVIYTLECEYAVAAPVAVTGVSLNKSSTTLNLNGSTTETLTATVAPNNATNKKVNWTSSVPSVASVSSSGVVTALTEGTTVVTATTADGSFTASCTVTVINTSPTVTSVEITGAVEGQEIQQGATLQLGATVTGDYDPAQTVTWSTSVSTRATVSASGLVKAGSSASSLGTVSITATSTVNTAKSASITLTVVEGTGTGGDVGDYYAPITDAMTGNTLLTNLNSLNSTKRKSTVGYSQMGTSTSGQFKYTDYDPNYTETDSQGRTFGTRILSFYSGTSCTSFNREHVWPDSRGGNLVESDIFMPRPTITAENSNRGNSSYVENMSHSSNGWDPVTAFGASNCYQGEGIRGECARIIFYSAIANTSLKIKVGADTSYNNSIGDLVSLLRWNQNYAVNQREVNRQNGGQYLQGNRNPFVDHPEYACKIWGETNDDTRAICGTSSATKTLTDLSYSGSPTKTSYTEGESFNSTGVTVTATFDDGSTSIVTGSVVWTPSVFTLSDTSVTGSYSYGGVTKTVTITGLTVTQGSGGGGTSSGDGNVINAGVLQSGFSYNNTSKVENEGYLGIYSGNYLKSSTFSAKSGSDITVSYDIGTYGGLSTSNQTLTVGAYVSGSLVSSTAQIVPSKKNTSAGNDTGTVTVTLNSSASSSSFSTKAATSGIELRIISKSSSTNSSYTRLYNMSYSYEEDSGDTPVEVTLTEITKSGTLTKTEYAHGDSFDPTGLSFTAHYSDSTTASISASDITWSPDPLVGGTASVTGTYTDAQGRTGTIVITGLSVSAPVISVISISIDPTSKTLEVGDTFSGFTITFNPIDATNQNVSWSSSDSSVVSVDQTGKITAESAGNATITVTTEDGNKTASCAITVEEIVAEKVIDHVELQTSSNTVSFACVPGTSYSVDADFVAYYTDNTSAIIEPTQSSLVVNPKILGNVTLSAKYESNTYKATKVVKVSNYGSSSYVGISANTELHTLDASYNATPTEQAEAWANYFIQQTGGSTYSGPCKLPVEQRAAALQDVWADIKQEYLWMVDASKDVFCNETNSILFSEAREHYRYITVTYNLEQFVVNSNGDKPSFSARSIIRDTFDNSTIILVAICLAGLVTVGIYFAYRKRKEI